MQWPSARGPRRDGVALLIVAVLGIGYFCLARARPSRAHALLAEALAVRDAPITGPGRHGGVGSYLNESARLQAPSSRFRPPRCLSLDGSGITPFSEAVGQVGSEMSPGPTAYSGADQRPATASTDRWRGSIG